MDKTETKRADSTWERDRAVLVEIYRRLDVEWAVETTELVELTGLSKDEILEAVMKLGVGGYINGYPEYMNASGFITVQRANRTERGLREVGAWPSAQSLADEFVAVLTRMSEKEPDPAKARSLRDIVKGMRLGHVADLARAFQALMDAGLLPGS